MISVQYACLIHQSALSYLPGCRQASSCRKIAVKWYKLCPKMRYPIITESFIGEMLMDGNYITKEVHNEFARRIDEENSWQNRRLSAMESFYELKHFIRRAIKN